MALATPGTSHWVPDPHATPELRELTVGQLLDESVERWPDQEAVVYSAYDDLGVRARWTFAELQRRARRGAKALMAAGIEHGDRAGIWATNVPQWLEIQFGAAYAGVVLVPMNPLYRESEVQFVLGKAGAAACFVIPEDRGTSLWDIASAAARGLPDLRLRVAIGESPDAEGPSWEDWVDSGDGVADDALERRIAAVTPQHTSQIQFTSGTTGFPKGAELPHRGLVNNARLFAHAATMRRHGRHCNPMPFFHCGGCVMSTLGSVATGSALLPTLTFDAARVVRTIDNEGATSLSAVPTMMIGVEQEVEQHGGAIDSLELIVTGGSPVPVDVERRWVERWGVKFTITYGMTEASPVVAMSSPDDPEELQLATCGQPLPHVEVDIVDPDGNRVPLGEQGELRSRSAMVMNGYWDNPEGTAAAITADGFLRSGDLARMDAQGYVSITGRAKEMIIRGGENIYPAEIENALRELPGVIDASVVGVPDERYGEVCAAFVRLRDGAQLDAETMRTLLRERVARFKIPAHLRVVDDFPVTGSGKVRKFQLRERFLAEAGAAAAQEPTT